jgi:sporulation protein YlmC with PRC-barrel domain
MSRDPVAWTMIEAGWKVFDAEGDEIGTVYEITGDAEADIFDGLAIEHSGRRYVPSEKVGQIFEGEVHLTLTRGEVATLDAFKEPPVQEQILPQSARWWDRMMLRLFGRSHE